jgi:hypothetical protein
MVASKSTLGSTTKILGTPGFRDSDFEENLLVSSQE